MNSNMLFGRTFTSINIVEIFFALLLICYWLGDQRISIFFRSILAFDTVTPVAESVPVQLPDKVLFRSFFTLHMTQFARTPEGLDMFGITLFEDNTSFDNQCINSLKKKNILWERIT